MSAGMYRGVPLPADNLRPLETAWWKLGVDAALGVTVPLLDDLADGEPCRLDHHGYCQMHGLPEPGPCPDGEARKLLSEVVPEG